MKTEELKKLYPVTPQMHRSVENALQQLDSAAPERYRRRRSVRRFVIVSAVILVTAALTTAAYASQLFGLLTEKVGKYGVDLRVVEETSPSPSSARIHMMPNPTYLPEGCRQMIGGEDEDHLILNPEGVTSYNKNGNYKYTDGNDTWVHFHVYEADKFHEEARYIVDRKETEYNGHKTVFLTRQFEENGDRDQYAIKYFEDCGYVVDCYYLDMTELRKIMEGLELREAEDDRDTPTVDNINDPVDPYAGYAFSMEEEQREYRLGETFNWSFQIVNAPSPDYCYQDGKYEITVKAVKEHDGVKGLDRNNLLAPDDEEWYSRYFNDDGSLKTPYIRTDRENGDGINSLDRVDTTEANRCFYLITIEVKAIKEAYGGFNGQFMTNAGGAIYRENHNENGSKLYTVGVIADEDELSGLALRIPSHETVIDDKTETIVSKDVLSVVPLSVGQ